MCFLRMITAEDTEWSDLFQLRLAEIPASLRTRIILRHQKKSAFWANNFNGYSTGFTFSTNYRVDMEKFGNSDPDRWPDLTATSSGGLAVVVELTIDGDLRSNVNHGANHLHLVSANAVPGIAQAEWWVPQLPSRSMNLAFRFQDQEEQGNAEISFDAWKVIIDRDLVLLRS